MGEGDGGGRMLTLSRSFLALNRYSRTLAVQTPCRKDAIEIMSEGTEGASLELATHRADFLCGDGRSLPARLLRSFRE